MDEETGLYYYGTRYLDPKYSRWLSGDPALSDYIPKASINDEAKKHNENLPGMGGVYNTVNLHLYHYAGNNPVKYTDPDGKAFHIIAAAIIGGGLSALKAAYNGKKSGREIAAAAVGGAVFGGMVAATGGLTLGAQLAGGAMAGTAAYLAENVVTENESTLGGAVISTLAGTSAVMTGKIHIKSSDNC